MIKTILEGSEALFGEVASLLEKEKINYVIMGGWTPYLLNNGYIQHPGTKDVDILFDNGSTENFLEDVLRKFISIGFNYSAKHHFQILKSISVAGETFVYNVDLIHPVQSKDSLEFVNHLEVPIRISAFSSAQYSLRTISLPGGDVFFRLLSKRHSKVFTLESGISKIEFTLLNEAGLVISKCKSFFNPKRDRDAFDIYLAIAQCSDYGSMVRDFLILKARYPEVYASLYDLYKTCVWRKDKSQGRLFYDNVLKYAMVRMADMEFNMEKFFCDIRFEE